MNSRGRTTKHGFRIHQKEDMNWSPKFNLTGQKSKGPEIISVVSGLYWTGAKRDLTEPAYAIKKYVNDRMMSIPVYSRKSWPGKKAKVIFLTN